MKAHQLEEAFRGQRATKCLDCGESVPLFPSENHVLDERLAQMEHRISVLMRAAENRNPSRRD